MAPIVIITITIICNYFLEESIRYTEVIAQSDELCVRACVWCDVCVCVRQGERLSIVDVNDICRQSHEVQTNL